MLKTMSRWFAFCSALFLAPMAFSTADVSNPAVVEAFVDGVVKPMMDKHHSPSGVVMVMKDGEIVMAKGYGYIDVERRIPVDPRTSLFRPGSISKLFTWLSVMQQVERGKLDLDADVNQYLNTFQVEDSWPGQPVTLRHILTHTGGFEDGAVGYLIINDTDRIIPLAESLAKYQPKRVNPPGVHTAYSNWGTSLAGLIVQNVSGIPFNDYVQQNIFDVLGMAYSSFVEPLPPELDANMAKAYGYEPDQYNEINYEIVSNFGPAGAAAVSAYDMSLFARALLNGGEWDGRRIIGTDTLNRMLTEGNRHDPRVRGMALGFIEYAYGYKGLDIFGHDGGTTVFLSHFGLSLKEDFMLFSSFSGPGGGAVWGSFVKSFYDEFFPPEVPYIEPPEDFGERAQKYAGTYNSWRSSFTKFESLIRGFSGTKVTPLPDNTLLIGDTRYAEVGKNLFRDVDSDARMAFQEDDQGNITGAVIDGMGVMQLFPAPFYETANFLFFLLGFCLLAFIGVVLRLIYRWSDFFAQPAGDKQARLASLLVAACNLLFFIFIGVTASLGFQELMYAVPTSMKISLIFSTLACIAGLYHLYQLTAVWRGGLLEGLWSRIRFSGVSLAALAMIWFYWYWNLIGFSYHT